jgi:uncharacterized protein (DUF433 family)
VTESEFFGVGVYTRGEAVRLSGLPASTVRNWIGGYYADGRRRQGFIEADLPALHHARPISFLALIELCLLEKFREHPKINLSPQKIRLAAATVRSECGISHPFAWEGLRTDGKEIFMQSLEQTGDKRVRQLTGKLAEHYVMAEVVEPFFKHLRFSLTTGFAAQWQPEEGGGLVVVDPMVRFGDPIIANTRIPTRQVFEQIEAGDSKQDVASFYRIDIEGVEAAWRFERRSRSAA